MCIVGKIYTRLADYVLVTFRRAAEFIVKVSWLSWKVTVKSPVFVRLFTNPFLRIVCNIDRERVTLQIGRFIIFNLVWKLQLGRGGLPGLATGGGGVGEIYRGTSTEMLKGCICSHLYYFNVEFIKTSEVNFKIFNTSAPYDDIKKVRSPFHSILLEIAIYNKWNSLLAEFDWLWTKKLI